MIGMCIDIVGCFPDWLDIKWNPGKWKGISWRITIKSSGGDRQVLLDRRHSIYTGSFAILYYSNNIKIRGYVALKWAVRHMGLQIFSFLGPLPILYTSRVISATPVVPSCFNYTTNFCFSKSSSHLSIELQALQSTVFNMSVLGYSTGTSNWKLKCQ